MTQSVQNFDNRNNYANSMRTQSQQGRIAQPQAVRIPDYYVDNNKKSFKDILEENPLYSTGIKGFFGPLIEHPFASLLTWLGCSFLLDKYTAACSGEYNKSLLKKVTNFGDNIENSKFIQSKPIQKLLGLFKSGSKKGGKLLDKSSVMKAIKETPSMPEWEMVKSEMIPQRQRIMHDFNQITHELKLGEEGFASLNKLALNKKEKDLLKQVFNVSKISDIPHEEQASSYIQLKRLGKTDAEIMSAISKPDGGVSATKQAILKAFGDKDAAWIKAVREDTIGKYIPEVEAATKNVGSKVKIGLGNFSLFGIDLTPINTFTKRILGCDNVHNRSYSLGEGAKTATGRFMSRFMQMVHRGLTFGGGKLGVLLFIAPAFVETAINVHKAEPNQKVGTGVSNLTNHISWVFTFPFALQIMHHICGAQYAGMTKDQVQELRKLQSDFNKKNKNINNPNASDSEKFHNYKEYQTERKEVNRQMKKLKEVKGQKWYTKCIRKLANMITPDLGKLDAYNTGNFVTTKFHQLRNLPRNLFGVPVRLILFGLLTMGVLDTALNKSIKFIFGDSYDSMKEEEQKDAKKEQKRFLKEDLNDRLYDAQRRKIMQRKRVKNVRENINNNPAEITSDGHTIAHKGAAAYQFQPQMSEPQIDSYTYIPSSQNVIQSSKGKGKQDTYTYIPSQQSVIKSDKNSNALNERTYIPSQKAANIQKSWDNSGLQAALNRAQRAEDRALKVLAGNFEDMQ